MTSLKQNQSPTLIWPAYWRSLKFRKILFFGLGLIAIILSLFPFFFQAIEKRQGYEINDWFLNILPARDVSTWIFFFIWTTTLVTLVRSIQDPMIFLTFLWSYSLLCLTRVLTITLVPLEPPKDLHPIVDAMANAFYGPHFITRDLFFSGHTATVFLMGLCLKKKYDKMLAFVATSFVGILLLIQHVHYTIDVIVAPFLTWLIFMLAKKIVGKQSPVYHN
jgi:PAP2 superfamily C-terminal